MTFRLEELRNKEVIDISSGEKLGFIDDAELNIEDSSVSALIIYGRYRLFGIFGREEDIVIPCEDVEIIGKDVVLVKRISLTDSIKIKRNIKLNSLK